MDDGDRTVPTGNVRQDDLYRQFADELGAAIVVGFLTTTRFPHGPALFGVLAWIACGTCAGLVFVIRNNRREVKRYQALIDGLNQPG